jgi:hypothetical protein
MEDKNIVRTEFDRHPKCEFHWYRADLHREHLPNARQGDAIFLETISGEGSLHLVIPPTGVDGIARQRDSLTTKERCKVGRASAEARKQRGELPGFMKRKEVIWIRRRRWLARAGNLGYRFTPKSEGCLFFDFPDQAAGRDHVGATPDRSIRCRTRRGPLQSAD